jgi:hypothetical protein
MHPIRCAYTDASVFLISADYGVGSRTTEVLEAMRAAFMQLFWGLLIIAVDVKFEGFDAILPDPIGYVFMISALRYLSRIGSDFSKAMPYAVLAGIVSIPLTFSFDPHFVLTLLSVVLDAVTIWYICSGIIQVAMERGNSDLVVVAETRRKWYATAALASLTVASLNVVFPELAVLLLLPVALIVFAGGVLVMLLLRRAAIEIS